MRAIVPSLLLASAAIWLASLASADASESAFRFERVAQTGQAAPGDAGVFRRLESRANSGGAIDERGELSFFASLEGGPAAWGVFETSPSGPRTLVHPGDPVAGLSARVQELFPTVLRSGRGETFVRAGLTRGSSFCGGPEVVVRASHGAAGRVLEPVLVTGDAIDDDPDRRVGAVVAMAVSHNGVLAVAATVSSVHCRAQSILVDSGDGFEEVFSTESPPFSGFRAWREITALDVNDRGGVVFGAAVDALAGDRFRPIDNGLFRVDGRGVQQLLLTKEVPSAFEEALGMPITSGGIQFAREPRINEAGQAVFGLLVFGRGFSVFSENRGRYKKLSVGAEAYARINDTRDVLIRNPYFPTKNSFGVTPPPAIHFRAGSHRTLVIEGGMEIPGTPGRSLRELFMGELNDQGSFSFTAQFEDDGQALYRVDSPSCNDARDNDHDGRADWDGARLTERDASCRLGPFSDAESREAP